VCSEKGIDLMRLDEKNMDSQLCLHDCSLSIEWFARMVGCCYKM
jgi:hypothetical protein